MLSRHSCAVVIQNGDSSHIEGEDDLLATIMANVERLAIAEIIDTGDTGYFDCSICENTTMGTEYMVELI